MTIISTIGFILHTKPIATGKPDQFTRDWALIELYKYKIDCDPFMGTSACSNSCYRNPVLI